MKTKIFVLGIDIGKNLCSLVGLDASGAVVLRRRAKRETLVGLAAQLSPCVVAMEACCGAHHLGRLFATHGHEVRLMSPEYVRPYEAAGGFPAAKALSENAGNRCGDRGN